MRSPQFLLLVVIFTAPVVWAAEPAAPPETAAQPADAASPADRLKANPNDTAALNEFMRDSLQRVRTAMDADPKAAESTLQEMKQLLESLKPDAEPAKQLLNQANRAVALYEQQVELARTPLEEITTRLQANPDDQKALTMFRAKVSRQVSPIARSEPDKAEVELKAAQELLAKLRGEAKNEEIQKLYAQTDELFGQLQSIIDAAKRLLALVGQPAAPLNVEAWVNGTPLSDADLKGKVVLLDFWAVWCGPCIATFPHLREWQEKYTDKGLVIVGLTKYYGFAWDAAKGQPTRPTSQSRPPQPATAADGTAPPPAPPVAPTPAEEQEMLKKFAEKHELHHRFAIQKDDSLSLYYGVTGIPHAVVIDRDGIVRLIRVGSGEQNAQDIEETIVKLLGDGANQAQ